MATMQNTIQVTFEQTPNPATMKFVVSNTLVDESMSFETAQEADASPLAAKIFGFPWTQSVFLGPNFVSVTKQDWVDWEILASPLADLISQHLNMGEPILLDLSSSDEEVDDTPLVRNIKRVLSNEIRPVVALDGGDILFAKFEAPTLYVHMRGACAGCPSSQATLKEGIEVRMRELFPEVESVVAI